MKNVLSFDFGASSGRAILGNYDGFALHLKEICRFENEPIIVDGTLYWDIDVLFGVVKKSTKKHR
ncbi:hypothetical protein RWE15_03450 [Virgibacillus halophilus]|uniref:Rhamnulokinase n=1 Tax=Tigheibacillus halophilus TaxID=361280 RepID=A0ABU5C529_9BACI|nr:hypothetical protein [Virgibacillus halophilus]